MIIRKMKISMIKRIQSPKEKSSNQTTGIKEIFTEYFEFEMNLDDGIDFVFVFYFY